MPAGFFFGRFAPSAKTWAGQIGMTRCPRCGKKSMMANKRKLLRGNYNPVNRYRKYPNLQWALVDGKRTKICTSCIKTLGKI